MIRIASSEQVTFSGRTTLVDGVWLNRSNGLRRLWATGAAPTDLVDVMRGHDELSYVWRTDRYSYRVREWALVSFADAFGEEWLTCAFPEG